MSVKEYSLKFVKLSKYASSLVSNIRDDISRFVTGVSEDKEKECQASMLHDNMDLSSLWFMHSRWRRVVGEREFDKARSLDSQIRPDERWQYFFWNLG